MTVLNLKTADPYGIINQLNVKYFLHSSGELFKICTECKVAKTLDEFHKNKSGNILQRRAECKECVKKRYHERAYRKKK